MGAAIALAQRGVGRTAPNPSVGCVIVRDGRVVGRGWTQAGGRPHAEAMALAMAGAAARGATAYVTLEPCAHVSARGPACADLLIAAGVARVVAAVGDPDPRTDGAGLASLAAAGIAVTAGVRAAEAEGPMAGFLSRLRRARPFITLKLAVSLDGSVALASGESQWITGPRARAHAHLERARADMILVGRGTLGADNPRLDVRLAGLEDRSPLMAVMSATDTGRPGMRHLANPAALAAVADADFVLAEGGAGLAASLVAADFVDRLLLYRAPILLGGRPALNAIGLPDLASAHGRWTPAPTIDLGADRLETYFRTR
ncbi:bifunctional diaminohydroxyphosphoribosylaminopyrimidine deaminase/5-amino-6-(5-phosphoribosylamino)uracil reductase RibD [Polymorphobacter fuscus]|uniref:Riboflavin biosynthesis protein RibD n=1 Tax=Sandarakinorhabdus fusca TaxID=1439888 RepID=A0A7C9KWH0_9SPHN|nr:bifunctional diaminohydroxyphosphoribosylaminopyrimidine deaminase/5-amino-6-(5-phosphoribosylamino)uracil reductase RibD [Polymorphobacter fuscus]KAB7647968.1 bifunctional diaminohydroxyphosphoribosylaminopyrimidine deaminase/5-amino-6-(5-phosphoribosylamino)uracil reductase RibD [Polymorphobacter fuscus]MQT16642.1 bifunctional diaminohydroxyphosphoribosylaminopyrimidine deaminase/5-amino-6-(5-phosphoribosylamino)uracil reductase RibD [Polymorphobacter fuscus]